MDVGGRMGGVKERVFIKGGACGDGVKDNETMGGWHLGLAVAGVDCNFICSCRSYSSSCNLSNVLELWPLIVPQL